MDSIYLTPEHALLREQVARFLAREVEPHGEQWEAAGFTPREVLRKLGGAGLLGLPYEAAYGGAEADALTNLVFAEALAQSTFAGFVITVLVHTDMASPHLHHAGSAAQKAKYLPAVTRGECITAVAITEPGAGSDVAGIRTRAVRDGAGADASWVLDGTKMFITNGVHADLYFVAARTSPSRTGISIFIVEKGTPGFTVGRQLDKTGWLSSDTAELVFDGCRIPAANLLGEENEGFRSIMKNFQTERIALAAMAVGHCTQALALTLAHVRDRRAFGAPLWDKQTIRQRLAMLDAKTRAARQYLYHCAWLVTQGRGIVQDVSMLKALTGELAGEVVGTCQQFHGGMGYMRGTAIERLWRDARVLAIGGGATEVMLDEAAKRYWSIPARMEARPHFALLARYNAWATRKLFEHVDALPDEDYRRDAKLFFKSVHGTLNHLLVGEHELWRRRFAEGVSPRLKLDDEIEPDRARLRQRLIDGAAAWPPLIALWSEDRFDGVLAYTSTQGVAMQLPFAATLAHVFNHGTHHRGQITAALTAMGHACPELDLVWMLQAESRAA